jgi:large subunit ribosomal protein L20
LSRVKRGPQARKRHNKVLKLTKGYYDTRHRNFRRANEAMLAALVDAYRDRRRRKRDFRRLWIIRVNAAARQHGLSYSQFMRGLKEAGVEINRKLLADMAIHDAAGFARLADVARGAVTE